MFFFNEGAVYIHDSIKSDVSHSYSQIFNVGQDVILDTNQSSNISLTSIIDGSKINLIQLNKIDAMSSFYGSLEPIRGWKSTTFNQVEPIPSLNYYIDGDNVEFSTCININIAIEQVEQNNGTYQFLFSNGSTISVITN